MSEEMSKKLHQETQERLAQYLLKKSLDHKAQQHREALLAQVRTDVDLLMRMCQFFRPDCISLFILKVLNVKIYLLKSRPPFRPA